MLESLDRDEPERELDEPEDPWLLEREELESSREPAFMRSSESCERLEPWELLFSREAELESGAPWLEAR